MFLKSGAYAQNLPAQVQYIYDQMSSDPNIDMENSWKVMTILIGANNLCLSCFSELDVFEAANVYEEYMRQTVALVHKIVINLF